ncbi:MAG: hypothetical protein IJD13_01455 [Oscillospiraceae bacterium]|nr:hypothetical protein [Oscillospiraceae bacterium]
MGSLTVSGREVPCGEARWKTRQTGAGVLHVFTPASEFAPGASVRFYDPVTGECVFDGFVFTSEQSEEGIWLTAYDRLRYLMYRDTKVFSGKTAAEIIREICGERGLPVGDIEENGRKIASLIADNRPLLDMIRLALEQSRLLGGEAMSFFDDRGKLVLKREKSLMLPVKMDGKTLVSSYRFTDDIGTDTYNRVRLIRKNRRSGRRDIFVKENPASIAKWGVLQYCAQVLQSTTDGEIAAMMNEILGQKNRAVHGIEAECTGDSRFRAGTLCQAELGGFSGSCRILEADHRYTSGGHTMKLKLEAV